MKTPVLLVGAAFLIATPAIAKFRLIPAGTVEPVGKLGLTVTPGNDWNRLGAKIGRNAESWTLDGLSLNDLSFYGGIEDGAALFKERDKKDKPLPKFAKTMLPTDIVSLFEGSYRVAAGTSLFETGTVEPTIFAGHPGVHFTYSFTQQGEEVKRNGEGTGAIINGRLYLITFEAPVIYYFDRDVASYRTVVSSAKVG